MLACRSPKCKVFAAGNGCARIASGTRPCICLLNVSNITKRLDQPTGLVSRTIVENDYFEVPTRLPLDRSKRLFNRVLAVQRRQCYRVDSLPEQGLDIGEKGSAQARKRYRSVWIFSAVELHSTILAAIPDFLRPSLKVQLLLTSHF